MTFNLAVKLRNYYVEHTSVAREIEDKKECLAYLEDKELESGICNTSYRIFDSDIYNSDFILKVTNGKDWVTTRPYSCHTQFQIIKSLEYRINLLNEFINENKNKTVKLHTE